MSEFDDDDGGAESVALELEAERAADDDLPSINQDGSSLQSCRGGT